MKTSPLTRFSRYALALAATLLAACATVPVATIPLDPGAELTTLSSPVQLKVDAAGKKMSVGGYLLYERPDKFHLTVLSPFGLTLAELFLVGPDAVFVQRSEGIALRGPLAEMPERRDLGNWKMVGWLMDPPPLEKPDDGVVVRRSGYGKEMIYLDSRGLVTRKTTDRGDEALYGEYVSIGGVPVPSKISAKDRNGDSVTIIFEEPEVNQTLEPTAFTPALEGLKIIPFSSLSDR